MLDVINMQHTQPFFFRVKGSFFSLSNLFIANNDLQEIAGT